MNHKNAWLSYSEEQMSAVQGFAEDYMNFMSLAKTERRFVKEAIQLAEGFGYKNVNTFTETGTPIKAGDKIYFNVMDKSMILMEIGTEPLEKGLNIMGAHVDSPRVDLKSVPLYEKDGLAYFDTHYYGGIKKYQWTTLPLALYGVIVLKDGTHIDVAIGDHPEDEVFCFTDLLPHLDGEQREKTMAKGVAGEDLDLLVGSIPARDVDKDAVKANILSLLKDRYGIDEEDFISAELEIVPQGRARTMGLDKSMILAYGQDDKVCAYTSLMALLEAGQPLKKTGVVLLVDKEEIGSVGATGMQSNMLENAVAEVMNAMGDYSELKLRRALQNSNMLSNDVCALHDPVYASVSSPNGNMPVLGGGVALIKYTGAGGKSRSKDANAEYLAKLRKIFDDAGVIWQTGELGKVDAGGGGTIAYILAKYGMNVIDCGVGLLNMHAPFEVSSKADVYEALKAYRAFIQNA